MDEGYPQQNINVKDMNPMRSLSMVTNLYKMQCVEQLEKKNIEE